MTTRRMLAGAAALCVVYASAASANSYREKDKAATVAGSSLSVKPPRDWNRLDAKPGKFAETWTLDGEQLNDVTFYAAVEPGQPLVRERNKKRDPLPKFAKTTLLIEVPELLEGTYRAYKKIADFNLTGSYPDKFLGQDGIRFTYDFVDADALPRKGEARAALIDGKLYMATFDAPGCIISNGRSQTIDC